MTQEGGELYLPIFRIVSKTLVRTVWSACFQWNRNKLLSEHSWELVGMRVFCQTETKI